MSISNPWFAAALIGLVGGFHLDLLLDILNLSRLRAPLPPAMKDVMDDAKRDRAAEYHMASTRFAVLSSGLMLGLTIGFWFAGGFGRVALWSAGLGLGPIATGVVMIGALVLVQTWIQLPFSAWDTFKIEAAFGFNTTTVSTFIADTLKSLALTALLGAPLLALLLWFFHSLDYAALWAWAATAAWGLLMSWLAPMFLMPLFLKFDPLPEGDLRTAILALAQKLDFTLGDISVVDGSRRSTKANAFFAGFGKTRRIALYDTLIANHSQEEILAVLAHEIGHAKLGHVPKQVIGGLLSTGVMFALLHVALNDPRLFAAFGVTTPTVAMGLVLFMLVYQGWSVIAELPLSAMSRKHEFEADAFARKAMGSGAPLISALKKLAGDHLDHLTPHPAYVAVHHSHPPMAERVAALS